ncbi:hypothetical protein [Lentibacillus juripiscarius]|uniref:Uncharacterized protein n=1 Tax=Lentibacillus juripiscarius TaxID=257446 RepID=A0ABW5V9S9_9BACI
MSSKTVYLLFTDTGTCLARVINFVTRQPLNHVSITFDPELREVYSFGRKRPRNPFIGGFVKEDVQSSFLSSSDCALYAYVLTEEDCQRVKKRIAEIEKNKRHYKYNFIGLFGVLLQIRLRRDNALFCSQFVATVLLDATAVNFSKPACFMTPTDIRNHKGMRLVYEGRLADYWHNGWRSPQQTDAGTPDKKTMVTPLTKKIKRLVIR